MDKNYKLKDITEEFKKLNVPSRKRELVDQRSYLIALLYFKFDLTEEQIASKINIKRAKVQYNKHLPAKYSGQPDYAYNIEARKELGHTDVAITVRYLINKALKNKIWDT